MGRYDLWPRPHAPERAEADRGSITGYAAIKDTALVIIVLAIIGFLVWALGHFFT